MTYDAPDAIAEHSKGFATAAAGHLDAPVRHCPGWTVADLTRHLLEVQWFWATIVEERLTAPPTEDRRPSPLPDDELVERFVTGSEHLVAVLGAAEPTTPVWTWAPTRQDAGFVIRHQVQEAAVHHWDAAQAGGTRIEIASDVAADAVEEFLTFSVSCDDDPAEPARPALDGRFVLRCTDIERAWTLADGATPGTVRHSSGAVPGLPAVTATGSDLLLWLYGRVPIDLVGVPEELVDRFRALTFTD